MTNLRYSLAIALVSMLAVTACRGDAHGSTTDGSSTAPSTAPAAADDAKSFTLQVTVPPLQAGKRADAVVSVVAAKGYHWNLEYPAKLVFAGDQTKVALGKKEFSQMGGDFKASEAKADVAVALEAKGAGAETVKGELKFSICNDTTCLIKSAPIELAVVVAP
ncbi:MAG: hypothetical protein R3F39_22050 [Myxococcota bacterium]